MIPDIRSPRAKAADAIHVGVICGLAARSTDPYRAAQIAEMRKAPPVVKAAVAAITTVTHDELTFPALDAALSDGFLDSLRHLNALDASLASSIRVTSNTAATVIAGLATGTLVTQGAPKPLQALSFTTSAPAMVKVIALAVVNDEVLRGKNAAAALEGALRGGVAHGSGALLLSVLASGLTPIAATGTTAAALLTDLASALATITTGAGSRLYGAMSSAQAKKIALMQTAAASGERAFPDFTVNGGEIAGVTFVIDDSITDGSITIWDASRVLIADEGVAVRASNEATLQFDSAPTDPPVAGTVLQSLFQQNQTAIIAERYAGVAKASTTCAAKISGANYG